MISTAYPRGGVRRDWTTPGRMRLIILTGLIAALVSVGCPGCGAQSEAVPGGASDNEPGDALGLLGGLPLGSSAPNEKDPVASNQEGATDGNADGGDLAPGLYFAAEPLDGPRDLVVRCQVHAVDGNALPEGTYTWSFDAEVVSGPMSTHATVEHTFRTVGLHVVSLTLTVSGVMFPVGCATPSRQGAPTAEVRVWPMISGVVTDAFGAPVAGVQVTADGVPQAATTDERGSYSLSVPDGWSGNVTPSAARFAFQPPSRPYEPVHEDLPDAGFAATLVVNSAPAANAQSLTTEMNAAVQVELSATDPDGDSLTYVIRTLPGHGTLQDAHSGLAIPGDQLPFALPGAASAVIYTPNPDFVGEDGFTFLVRDHEIGSPWVWVGMSVVHPNAPPVAEPQSVNADEDVPTSIRLGASDPDGDSLDYRVVSLPAHGTLRDNQTGLVIAPGQLPYTLADGGWSVTYTNQMYFVDTDGFQFRVNDGHSSSAPATVTVTVLYGGHPPVADPVTVETAPDTPVVVTLHATDPHGDPLTYVVETLPDNGALSDNGNGHVILPGQLPYPLVASGNALTFTPNTGFVGSDGFSFVASDGHADSPPADASITVEGWSLPIGVPVPPFGINEEHTMYVGQQWNYGSGPEPYRDAGHGPYTHYIDNTNGQATDTNNPYGTPTRPRQTIPGNLPAGSVVEVHGGPYTFTTGGRTQLGGTGTATHPIFVRGVGASSRPVFLRETEMLGTYVIVEYLDISTADSVYVNGPNHHIGVRHSIKRDGVGRYNAALGVGGSSGNPAHDVVFYDNQVHDNGAWDAPPSEGDQDYHGLHVSHDAYNIWFLQNQMWHNSGDGIQINAGDGLASTIHHIYVGRNTAWENRQTGFWCKQARDVIFSQNVSHSHLNADSSGAGMGWQYDHSNLWFIANECYDNLDGIRGASGDGATYLVGNLIHDNSETAINSWSNAAVYAVNNTIYHCGRGISVETSTALYAADNIVASLTASDYCHLYIFGGNMQSLSHARNNLFYQSGGAVKIEWDSSPMNVAVFEARYGAPGRVEGNREGNPQFVDPASGDFHVQAGSPAVNNGTATGCVQEVYSTFSSLYGLNIAVDFDGTGRPVGAAYDIGAFER
jgi:hypothetical protein